MKFIGQYIHDLIARFRSDVYLEDVSSGTIASGGNLGLDSNNKIVKANEPTSHDAVTLAGTPDYITLSGQEITRNQIDLANDVTGALPVANGGTGATTLTSNSILTGNGTSAVQAESTLSYTSEILTIGADDAGEARIIRLTSSSDVGGDLSVKAGDGTGTNRVGGDLNLYGGTSTGAAGGGKIAFFASPGGGASGTTPSTQAEVGSINNSGNLQIDGSITVGSTSFVNSSGVVQVATQGTIDHDSLANFVAAEHYDWSSDISGTATIHANNITDLHGAGVSGSANQLLTDDGDGTVTSESTLSYSGEILDIGADDDGEATIRRLRHTDEAGGQLLLRGGDATGTDKNGGNLQLFGGRATGSGAGGGVIIQAGEDNPSSGTTLRGTNVIASFRSDGDTLLQGNLIFEGASPDAHETTFSITDPTADRTITVPNATGTMCISGASGTNMIVLGSGTGYIASPAAQTWHFGNSLYGFNHFNWKSVTASMVSDSSTFTLSEDYNGVGQFVPAALSKVVARVSCRPATTSGETFKVTICSADRDAGGTNTTWTALASATNETSIGVWEGCDATYTGSIATSKMLSIGIGIDESSVSTGNVRFNWQLVGYLA